MLCDLHDMSGLKNLDSEHNGGCQGLGGGENGETLVKEQTAVYLNYKILFTIKEMCYEATKRNKGN